jgi:hypothetical protein
MDKATGLAKTQILEEIRIKAVSRLLSINKPVYTFMNNHEYILQ